MPLGDVAGDTTKGDKISLFTGSLGGGNVLDYPKQSEHSGACPHSAGIILSNQTEKAV